MLTGSCLCGAVRFEVRGPFLTAGYCHCTRCRRRNGTGASLGGLVAPEDFAVVAGAEHVRAWQPPDDDGYPKSFCELCGGHLFSGSLDGGTPTVGVRFGALDGDPGIRPSWRQWIASAPSWIPIPDDGLPRYPAGRPG